MAIHEQNYTRYEGTLRERGSAGIIAWRGFRVMFSFWRTKLIMLGMLATPLLTMGAVFLEYTALSTELGQQIASTMGGGEIPPPDPEPVMVVCWMTVFSLGILYAASGCGVLSDDIRYKTFQLYFSKPITRSQYVGGKYFSLIVMGSIAGFAPLVAVGLMRVGLFFRLNPEFAWLVLWQTLIATGVLALTTFVMAMVVMGLSALTSQTRYVVLAWLGVMIVPMIVGTIITIASDSEDYGSLLSITGNMWMAMSVVLSKEGVRQIPVFAPFLALLAYGGLGASAVAWRVNRLEGVA